MSRLHPHWRERVGFFVIGLFLGAALGVFYTLIVIWWP